MKRIILFMYMILNMLPFVNSQDQAPPPTIKNAVYFDISPPIQDMVMQDPAKKFDSPVEVANKIGHREFNNRVSNGFPFAEDQLWQKQDGTYLPDNAAPLQNFDGITNLSNVYPPDTQGDVSLDKYVQVVNLNFAVYSKTGAVLLGPAALSTIWTGIPAPWNGTNSGDPIVLYDQAADRWIISQFSIPNYTQMAMLVAISQTSDPTGSWYRYVYDFGTSLPDYPKFGIWSDGYYISANIFTNGPSWIWAGISACALDRTKMLAGDPTAGIIRFDLPAASDPGPMLPADWDGANPPVAGEPNYFTYYDDWSHPTEDYLKIWALHADWVTPANSTFTKSDSLMTTPFDGEICTAFRGRCIPQPGTSVKLETLSDRLMYRMQYRNFGTHRSMVTNHTVDVDGTGHAGVRWYELRKSNGGWSIYQQGTYAPDADHRWMGSIAMNLMGDIALGYSVSNSTNLYPTIRYTGRHANDPLGQMTISEQTVITGTGSQTGSAARWGDYSMMSVDPVNDRTFWYTTEYVAVTGNVTWRTRIASFLFDNSPSVTTQAPSNVVSAAATINGTINPQGLLSSWYFQYGTSTSYGSTTPVTSAGAIPVPQNVSANITGLTLGTPVHYRLIGTNAEGTTYGLDRTFIPATTQVTTTAASLVTNASATTGGNIIIDAAVPVTARGVCWGLSANPDLSGSFTSNGTGTGAFTSNLTGLQPNTTYHVRAYAINMNGTYYGNDLTFTTYCNPALLPVSESFSAPGLPACWTQQITTGAFNLWSVEATGAAGGSPNEVRATFVNIQGYIADTRLVLPPVNTLGNTSLPLSFTHFLDTWSSGGVTLKIQTSPDGITWTNDSWSVVTSSSNIGPAVVNTTVTTNLNSPVTYIAFVLSGDLYMYDYWYIDNINLTGLPVLTTAPVTGITLIAASGGGNILSDGGTPVTARGICYGTTTNPVISGIHTTDGTGPGTFTSSLAGLVPNTQYYVRAYATTTNGTAYGNNQTFRTLCIPSTLPFSESFSATTIPDCWSQTDHQGNGQIWNFGVITGEIPLPALNGNYAYLNSDGYGNGNSQNADLVSPLIDMTAYGMITLQFNYYYKSYNGQTGSLYYSIDGGTTWTLLQQFTVTSTNPATFNQVIPALAGQSQVKFKWNMTSTWGWYWGIDNIQITGLPLVTPVLNVNIANGTNNCYEAVNNIIVAGSGTTFTVQNGGSATMVAGKKISYYPGTKVFAGGYMHGYISPSGPFCGSPLAAPVQTEITKSAGEDISSSPSIRVWPNPTQDKFTLEVTGTEMQEMIRVEILSARGEKIESKTALNTRSMELSLGDRPVGLYFLRVWYNDHTEVVKLIKY